MTEFLMIASPVVALLALSSSIWTTIATKRQWKKINELKGAAKMKYLGKKYLYNFLKEQGFSIPKLKDFYYAKWRGDEWIRGEKFFIMSYLGKAISIDVFEFDDLGERYNIESYTFRPREGKWVKTYYRDKRQAHNDYKGIRTSGV